MFTALKKDEVPGTGQCLLQIVKETASLAWHVGPFLLRALLPWHNPRGEEDPRWMKDWTAGHARLAEDDKLPLVDTSHPDMPVPFPNA